MAVPIYKTYMFKTKDPVIDELRTMKKDAGMSNTDIHIASGVSVGALSGWFNKGTRRPQNATVEAVGRSMGFKRGWIPLGKKK